MKLGYEMLVIAAGGACGAVMRYLVTISSTWFFKGEFPWGTFVANLLGCLLIGLLIGSGHDQKNEVVRLGFGVGFLGSLTTFSTFGGETIRHALDGNWSMATINVISHFLICLAAVAIGIAIAKKVWA